MPVTVKRNPIRIPNTPINIRSLIAHTKRGMIHTIRNLLHPKRLPNLIKSLKPKLRVEATLRTSFTINVVKKDIYKSFVG